MVRVIQRARMSNSVTPAEVLAWRRRIAKRQKAEERRKRRRVAALLNRQKRPGAIVIDLTDATDEETDEEP